MKRIIVSILIGLVTFTSCKKEKFCESTKQKIYELADERNVIADKYNLDIYYQENLDLYISSEDYSNLVMIEDQMQMYYTRYNYEGCTYFGNIDYLTIDD